TAEKTFLTLTPGTITLTAPTAVTSLMETAVLTGATIAADAATTVNKATTLSLVAPIDSTSATITDDSALRILNVTSGAGTLTNQYGLYIEDMTAGATADFGIAIEGADTAALWISSAVDTTDAANGIAFGLSRDTNLYRSAANTLKTDDALTVLGDFTVGATALKSVASSHALGIGRAPQGLANIETTDFTATAASSATATLLLNGTLTSLAGSTGLAGIRSQNSFTTGGGTDTYPIIAQGWFQAGSIILGTGDAVTAAATVYISGAMSGASTNYALYSASGANYFGGSVGIGTTVPDAALEINHATGDSLRLTYNDSNGSAANYTDFSLSSTGALTLTGSAATLAASATAEKTFLTLTPGTITLTAPTAVTSLMETAV
ncbi:MAG: hypothetical protein Q7J73_09325, partial [Dehalococcoidales bacterium]|nr:hypothetical protein [Dehalococcoidales bacterium]